MFKIQDTGCYHINVKFLSSLQYVGLLNLVKFEFRHDFNADNKRKLEKPIQRRNQKHCRIQTELLITIAINEKPLTVTLKNSMSDVAS